MHVKDQILPIRWIGSCYGDACVGQSQWEVKQGFNPQCRHTCFRQKGFVIGCEISSISVMWAVISSDLDRGKISKI